MSSRELKKVGKQASKQTSRQTGKQGGNQAVKQACKHAVKQAVKQAGKQAGKKAAKQAGKQALGRHSVRAMPWRGLFICEVKYFWCLNRIREANTFNHFSLAFPCPLKGLLIGQS